MSPAWDSNCPFHFQSDPDWCGPACAMMVLASRGVPYSRLVQGDLYSSIRMANCSMARWRSDPCGVESVLNAFLPGEWHLYLRNSLKEATRDIIYSLRQRQRATVALIYGAHWVAVDSVATTSDPAQGAYSVKALWIHNPDPSVRTNAPAEHAGGDVCERRGVPDKISWLEWKKQYLLAKKDALWASKPRFVVISDPDDRGSFGLPLKAEENPTSEVSSLIARNKAERYLRAYAEEDYEDPNRGMLQDVSNSSAGTPIRVVQPYGEEGERYYYLVPFLQQGKTVASMKIDSAGRFRSLRLQQADVAQLPDSDFANKRWVWMPSEESKSPHQPFMVDHDILMHNGNRRRLIRLDGTVFSELSPLKDG